MGWSNLISQREMYEGIILVCEVSLFYITWNVQTSVPFDYGDYSL